MVATAIKQFLAKGYSAIIAPFWGLHIDIPPIWLPEFLKCFSSGLSVSTSCFQANKKIAEHFNTPKAFACLHLYGNPFLSCNP